MSRLLSRFRRSHRRRDERGSMAVEIVILTPFLMMFIMLIVAGGRYVSTKGDIEATARDAARAASQETSAGAARAVAQDVVNRSLEGSTDCAPIGFNESNWTAGGVVVVRLDCTVSFSGLGLIGLPGSTRIDAFSAVPLDTYRRYE